MQEGKSAIEAAPSVGGLMTPENRLLWLPGDSLDHEFGVPQVEELQAHWRSSYQEAEMMEAPGVYGIIRKPDEPISRIASVDLCEVVRHTNEAVMRVEGRTREDLVTNNEYAANVKMPKAAIFAVVQALMNHAEVEPVDDIDDIRLIMQAWRRDGIYTVANTSTLPGCELATITWLGKYLPNCFDGILLPRNHHGNDPITKGHALGFILEDYSELEDTRAVHIDDMPHHLDAAHQQIGNLIGHTNVATFMPLYKGSADAPAHALGTHSASEAFLAADQFLRAG